MQRISIFSLLILSATISGVGQADREQMILDLQKLGGVMEGNFTLQTGIGEKRMIPTPLYIDLRRIISDPALFNQAADAIGKELKDFSYDHICAVPYGPVPLAGAVAVKFEQPLLMLRKEAKEYGAKKLVEGLYKEGDRVLLLEDVIVSGRSTWEACEQLRKEGLVVTDVITFFDREQGGPELLAEKGINVRSILTMTELVDLLSEKSLLKENDSASIRAYINEYNFQKKKE